MKLNRNDNVESREKIQTLLLKNKKRLGINTSTLYYVKRKLSDGNTHKTYQKIILKIK
jgi:hypothetical protein